VQDIEGFTPIGFIIRVAGALSLATPDWRGFQTAEIRVSIRAEWAPSLVILAP